MPFNKTTLRTDIKTFFVEMTNNQYFLNGVFSLFQNSTRPTHADCTGRNLFYCYIDGHVDTETSTTTNETRVIVVIGILKAELEILGVTQQVFDDTWSRLQTYFTRQGMRITWAGIPSVMGVNPPFRYADLGILDIRNYNSRWAEFGKGNSLRYEMLVEIKFNFNQNI